VIEADKTGTITVKVTTRRPNKEKDEKTYTIEVK
jgi:hypothetical protein